MTEGSNRSPEGRGASLLTLQEVSERTRVPIATLRYWKQRAPERGPKLFTLGGRGRVVAKAEDVDRWIEAQYAASMGAPAA